MTNNTWSRWLGQPRAAWRAPRATRVRAEQRGRAGALRSRPSVEALEDRITPATPVWVNDNWVEQANTSGGVVGVVETGDTVQNTGLGDNGTVSGKIFGTDAFATIQDGINGVDVGGIVNVLAGTYTLTTFVNVSKDVTISGPNAGINANVGAAINPARVPEAVVVGTQLAIPTPNASFMIGAAATTYTIDGLMFTGTAHPINSYSFNKVAATVQNNIFDGTDVMFFDTTSATGPLTFANNRLVNMVNIQGPNNVPAVQTGSSIAADTRPVSFTGNVVADSALVSGFNLSAVSGAVSGNHFSNLAVFGLLLANESGGAAGLTVANNTFNSIDVDANISAGLSLRAPEQFTGTVNVTGNIFTGNTLGVRVRSSNSGGTGIPVPNVTGKDIHINGNLLENIKDNVLHPGTGILDMSGNWWGSNTAAGVAASIDGAGAVVDYTPWLDSNTDISAAVGFQGDLATLHVDDSSPQTGVIGRIQEGIILATGATPTVIVEAGTYTESVGANKAGLTLDGATGVATDVVIDPPATTAGVTVVSNNVTLRDLRITGAGNALVASGQATLSLGNLQLDGNTSGGTLTNITTLNFAASSGNDIVTISGSQLSATNVQAISLTGVGSLNARGDLGSDTFNVTPASAMTINIDGDLPTPPATPGDRLNVNTAGTTSPTLTSTSTASGLQGSYTFGNRQPVNFQEIETLGTAGADVFAVGAAPGVRPRVGVFNQAGVHVAGFLAFAANFRGGVRVAVGDVNGDGTSDIIVAAGGGTPRVKVIDGTKFAGLSPNATVPDSALLGDFLAYPPRVSGGVFVAAGDVNGDGRADVITGKGAGADPRVLVIDGTKLALRNPNGTISNAALLGNFLPYRPRFRGGVTVGAGDVNGDGKADVIAGPSSGAERVKVINGALIGLVQPNGRIADAALLANFFAYAPGFSGGVFVAGGLVNADNRADIITGPGPGRAPVVKVIDATKANQTARNGSIAPTALLANVRVFATSYRDGVQVGAVDLDNDDLAEILAGTGPRKRRVLGLDVINRVTNLDLALDFNAKSLAGS
jgi:hypothetical protein